MYNRQMAVKRVYRQHNSLVVVLPIAVRKELEIGKGDYVSFEWDEGAGRATFGKVKPGQGEEREDS